MAARSLAVIVVMVVIRSGAASAIASVVVTPLIIFGSLIAFGVLGGIGWLIWRARQDAQDGRSRPRR